MGRGTSPTILRFGRIGGTPVVGPPYGMLSEPTAYSQGVYQEFIDGHWPRPLLAALTRCDQLGAELPSEEVGWAEEQVPPS